MPSPWTVRPSGFSAVRADGAKVGAFWPDGSRIEWWGYLPSGRIKTGPHQTLAEAQAAVDSALPMEIAS